MSRDVTTALLLFLMMLAPPAAAQPAAPRLAPSVPVGTALELRVDAAVGTVRVVELE